MVEHVILARHGHAENNQRGIVSADPRVPYPLTELGREQATTLGRTIADDPIQLCVASEFARTQETVDIALAGRDVPRLILAEFNDVRADGFEGQDFSEMQRWLLANGPATIPPGGGERRIDSVRRVCLGFRCILGRHEEVVLVVDHVLSVIVGRARPGKEDAVVTLGDVPVGHAECHRLSAKDLRRSVLVMERWVERVNRRARGPALTSGF
jgi:broad specificity phosphatase PhoE